MTFHYIASMSIYTRSFFAALLSPSHAHIRTPPSTIRDQQSTGIKMYTYTRFSSIIRGCCSCGADEEGEHCIKYRSNIRVYAAYTQSRYTRAWKWVEESVFSRNGGGVVLEKNIEWWFGFCYDFYRIIAHYICISASSELLPVIRTKVLER